MKKRLPDLKSDAEAEAFVSNADLTEYDLSSMAPVRFTLRQNTASVSVELPVQLVEQARNKAISSGILFQDFIRMAIEQAVLIPK